MATNETVITQVRRKNSIGFDSPLPIGTSAKYVTGIRGTGVNNIEENILLGYDLITTTEVNPIEGVNHIIKEFRKEEDENDYYYIDIYEYTDYTNYKRWFRNNVLFISTDDVEFDDVDHNFLMNDPSVYEINDHSLLMDNSESPDEKAIYIAVLHYINAEDDDISVSKLIRYSAKTENGKVVQKQIIQNLL